MRIGPIIASVDHVGIKPVTYFVENMYHMTTMYGLYVTYLKYELV